LSQRAIFAGCKNSGFVFVEGSSVVGQVKDSDIFISGGTVKIQNFFMCDHEVTQWEYEKTMRENPSYFFSNPGVNEEQENRPVECVSFYDAIVYCNKRSIAEGLNPCYKINGSYRPIDWGFAPNSFNAEWNAVTCDFSADGYRLPTEAEWEYAARGGKHSKGYIYSGSDTLTLVGWYKENGGERPQPVKMKRPNELGLYDMSGNMWEWCNDWYDTYSADAQVNPQGPSEGRSRVVRGGSWLIDAPLCRPADRSFGAPRGGGCIVGLRLAM
jgi:formylglycine-generating enzyme required for sulfatase activity